jgi:hypothetical protein
MSSSFRWVKFRVIKVAKIGSNIKKLNGPRDVLCILRTQQRVNKLRGCGGGVKEGEYRVIGPINIRKALEPQGEKAFIDNNIIDEDAFTCA